MILDIHHRVAAAGYNGYPSGELGCLSGGCPRGSVSQEDLPSRSPYHEGIGRCDAVHAEANCLLQSDWSRIQAGTIYITGQPCHGCLVLIKGSGLARALWPEGEWTR